MFSFFSLSIFLSCGDTDSSDQNLKVENREKILKTKHNAGGQNTYKGQNNQKKTSIIWDLFRSSNTSFSTRCKNRKNEVGVINANAYQQLVSGTRRGNSDFNDQYLLLSYRLEFYIPNNKIHSTIIDSICEIEFH